MGLLKAGAGHKVFAAVRIVVDADKDAIGGFDADTELGVDSNSRLYSGFGYEFDADSSIEVDFGAAAVVVLVEHYHDWTSHSADRKRHCLCRCLPE